VILVLSCIVHLAGVVLGLLGLSSARTPLILLLTVPYLLAAFLTYVVFYGLVVAFTRAKIVARHHQDIQTLTSNQAAMHAKLQQQTAVINSLREQLTKR